MMTNIFRFVLITSLLVLCKSTNECGNFNSDVKNFTNFEQNTINVVKSLLNDNTAATTTSKYLLTLMAKLFKEYNSLDDQLNMQKKKYRILTKYNQTATEKYELATKKIHLWEKYCFNKDDSSQESRRQKIQVIETIESNKPDEPEVTSYEVTGCAKYKNVIGIQSFEIGELGKVEVLCDSGSTVIQRRINGTTNFNANWTDYQKGFGDLKGEFFIGLETLHNLTASSQYELEIELEDYAGEKRNAIYDHFVVGPKESFYALENLGKYSGEAGDALSYHLYSSFYTFDRDNEDKCAENQLAGWWYSKLCGYSNLNGLYTGNNDGIMWGDEWHELPYSYKSVKMIIRPKN
ncbi:fibrinogen-like protein 1 [Drosophila bipectinata]|uniref:fibrinogen-like protein 1 n=1 Tax=Drosophila bipectinata TaxID=42026 RepID=UPI0038B3AADB